MFRARVNRRYTFDGASSQPENNVEDSEADAAELSPMIGSSANLMMSAMCTPQGNHLGTQVYGPPEAFYPFVSIAADGTVTRDSPSSSYDEDDVDDEDLLNIADLIDFGDDSSEDGEVEEDGSSSPANISSTPAPPSSTPIRPTTATTEDQLHPLLEHLDRGVVGASPSATHIAMEHSVVSRAEGSLPLTPRLRRQGSQKLPIPILPSAHQSPPS
jgi:hypothetical protein